MKLRTISATAETRELPRSRARLYYIVVVLLALILGGTISARAQEIEVGGRREHANSHANERHANVRHTAHQNKHKPAPAPGIADPFWDTSNTTGLQSGSGTWSTGAANWNPLADGTGTRVVWSNPGDAVFQASGTSTVTVSGTVQVNSITFNGTGYTIAGTALTLTGSNITANVAATISAPLAGSVGLTKSGAGTLTLSGANTLTGGITVNGGTLALDNSGSNNGTNITNNNALTLAGGTFSLIGGTNNTGETVSGLTLNSGASAITLTLGGGKTLLALNAITRNVGSTVNFTGLPTSQIGADNGITTTTGNTNSILGGYATVNGTDWATATSNGTNNNIAAFTAYSNDGFAANANTNITLNDSPAANININSLRFNTAAARTLTLSGTNIIQSGGILETSTVGNNASTITGGTLEGASGKDLIVIQNNTANSLSIGSVIADNTTATGLTKSGAGTLVVTGANTYTGVTTVNAGTLSVDNAGQTTARLANTSNITVNSSGTLLLASSNGSSTDRINNSATVTLNGGKFNTAGLSEGSTATAGVGALTLQNTSIIDLGAVASILHFAASNAATWIGNKILEIDNWSGSQSGGGVDQLIFGTDTSGLTAGQIAEIQFLNPGGFSAGTYGAMILSNGEIVPIPEPSTWAAGALALSSLVLIQRRRWISRFLKRGK
jgi:autotransporter-associated beta strand protein